MWDGRAVRETSGETAGLRARGCNRESRGHIMSVSVSSHALLLVNTACVRVRARLDERLVWGVSYLETNF